jgi:hypothetical protein
MVDSSAQAILAYQANPSDGLIKKAEVSPKCKTCSRNLEKAMTLLEA